MATTAKKTTAKAVPITSAKPAAKTSTAVAVKKPSGAIVSIREQLAAQAAAMADRVAPASGVMIRTAGKKFSFPDGTKSDGPVDLVVIDFVARNEFYEGAFDKDNITPPACFAIGTNPLKLVPSSNSPQQQADNCGECPMNAFGSKGKGKACANTRYLAVLPPDATADTPLALIKVSATATKGFDAFVRTTMNTFQVPPIGVVVSIGFNENEDYPQLTFGDAVPNENLEVHFARQEEAKQLLAQEPDVSSYQAAAAKPAPRRAGARR